MKFLFINYSRVPGVVFPEDWLFRIRGYNGILEALRTRHEVASIEPIDHQGIISRGGVQYHFIHTGGSSGLRHKMSLARKINRYAATLKPDIVIVHGMLFPLQVIMLKRKLGAAVKFIVQNHAEKPRQGISRFLSRIADRSVHAYLFAAREMGMDWVTRGIVARESKIREVMEASSVFVPSDRAVAKSRTGVREGLVFLWVGRLDENKDPLTVIRAFLQWALQRSDATLYMIFHTEELLGEIQTLLGHGSPTADSVHQGSGAHPSSVHPGAGAPDARVVLVGKVPHEEMGAWYNSADFIISGSHYEGSGVAVCEAMSCGCIPVVTDILSFRKMTKNGECGFLYAPGNVQALISALQQGVQTDREEIRKKVLTQFGEELSFQAIARRIEEVAG